MDLGKVAFDPGHYARYNAGPNGYFEGDAMLRLGLKLKDKGFFITREDGNDIGLLGRVKKAVSVGCDTLISLHTDWIPADNPNTPQNESKATEGTMVIYSLNRPEDQVLADYICKQVANSIGVRYRQLYQRHASRSTKDKPLDYYGILRYGVQLGLKHIFIIEHCNHGEMSENTEDKINRLAACYEELCRPQRMTTQEAVEILYNANVLTDKVKWLKKGTLDNDIYWLLVKMAKHTKGV